MTLTLKHLVISFLCGVALTTALVPRVQGQAEQLKAAPVGMVRYATHIAIVTPDGKTLAKDLTEVIGIPMPSERTTNPKGIVFSKDYPRDPAAHSKVHVVNLPNMNIEVVEPVGGKSPWRDSLDRCGGRPNVHHIAFDVPDMQLALDRLTAKDGRMSLGDGKMDYAYMETSDRLGLAVELHRVAAKP